MVSAFAWLLVEDGRLRPVWRAVLFFGIGSWVLFPRVLDPLFMSLAGPLHIEDGLSPSMVAFGECELLVGALILTAAFALYEGRSITSYGLTMSRAFGVRFWEGAAVGAVSAALVALGMIATGAMRVDGFALRGTSLATGALAWLGTNILVGFGEELWYRGYLLQTLRRSLGFWPAALALALIFTSDHYFYKHGENIYDVVTLLSLALVLSYTIWRTRTLWFAIGFHIAFDYMQLFVIGTRNGSLTPKHHLLVVSFPGSDILTGGALGTEASVLMYPVIAAIAAYVWWRFRTPDAPLSD